MSTQIPVMAVVAYMESTCRKRTTVIPQSNSATTNEQTNQPTQPNVPLHGHMPDFSFPLIGGLDWWFGGQPPIRTTNYIRVT